MLNPAITAWKNGRFFDIVPHFPKENLLKDINGIYIYIYPICQIKAHEILKYMQKTSFKEIRNVGTTLNVHICGDLGAHFWEKLENHGERTHISDENMWCPKGL